MMPRMAERQLRRDGGGHAGEYCHRHEAANMIDAGARIECWEGKAVLELVEVRKAAMDL
jgi:hypothetical protein